MKQKEIADKIDEKIGKQKQENKPNKIFNAFLIGIFIGIAIYSVVKNGFGFGTFFPLFFAYLLVRKGKDQGDTNNSN